MYSIVKFLPTSKEQQATVGIVPVSWLFRQNERQLSYWPITKDPSRFVIAKAVPTQTWLKLEVVILNKIPFDSYSSARQKLPRAEENSDLSSSDEGILRKRTACAPVLYADEFSTSSKRPCSSSIVSTPNRIVANTPRLVLVNSDPIVSHDEDELLSENDLNLVSDSNSNFLPLETPEASPTSVIIEPVPDDLKQQLNLIASNQEALLKNQIWLKLSVSNLERKVDIIATSLESMHSPSVLIEVLEAPFENETDFFKFDNELKESAEKRNYLREQLKSFGGNSVSECVNTIMKKLMNPVLADKFSAQGKGDSNRNFSSTQAHRAIQDALKASKKYEEVQIGKALVEWFRRTGSRLKDFKKKNVQENIDGSADESHG